MRVLFLSCFLFFVGCQSPVYIPRNSALARRESEALGFTEPVREQFWSAWRADITSAAHPEWWPMVTACSNSKNMSLRTWAFGRLAEAGIEDAVPAYCQAMGEALNQLKGPDPDWRKSVLNMGSPYLPGAIWQIRRDSPFWKHFHIMVLEEAEKGLRQDLYAVWSWNSAPEDREMVYALAAKLGKPQDSAAPWKNDPWKDLRFWLVMDWLCTHGERSDWEQIIANTSPSSTISNIVKSVFNELNISPTFLTKEPVIARSNGVFPELANQNGYGKVVRTGPLSGLNVRGRFSFNLWLGLDGKVVRCRPRPAPWVAGATSMGVSYFSSWEFRYPGVPKSGWPGSGLFIGDFVLD